MRNALFICSLLLLSACATQKTQAINPPPPPINSDLFNLTAQNVITKRELIQLTPRQIEEINVFALQPHIAALSKREQATAFIKRKMVNFDYEGKNLPANVAFDQMHGNCMTLALLSYSIAMAFDVDISFQRMFTAPMLLNIDSDFMVTSDHVRSFLSEKTGQPNSASDEPQMVTVIDYFPDRFDRAGEKISEAQFFAMLYRNFAADALLEGRYVQAMALLNEAITYAPYFAPALDMVAIAHRRMGDAASAQAFYQFALENGSTSKLNTLNNYYVLLLSIGDTHGAENLQRQLQRLDDESPYGWYLVANDAINAGDLSAAKLYLERFIERTAYYYPAYLQLAKVEYQLGNTAAAKRALNKALVYVEIPERERQYRAKLAWLSDK
ncbi:tetratricopeptide repeat protein [Shewanella waksmanii]|uniref:tetratricopeptide repeat protein n=1 Tax=Shewanella waksmanii TaxID=213783 RepID=UPI003736E9FF